MKVGELRHFLNALPDDTPVLVPGEDHSYHQAGASLEQLSRPEGLSGSRGSHTYYDPDSGEATRQCVVIS